MTFHRIGKNQAMTNVALTATPGGAWNPAMLPQWIELGLKNGRKISTVIGSMDRTPSTVANAAPSLIPNQDGMNITRSRAKQIATRPMPIGVPHVVPTGSMVWPVLKLKRTARYDPVNITLIGATGNQPSQ